ncbi:DNA repair protein RecO [Candidatus Methylobacter favarea]|uniref:DNA repair protein RecO n=1 Tax=Candidatus Methylobacter favarea TaxID=2707345 RepID=A0A8S0X7Y2_9GAMM|nr:DNA repair protein RecO [Candidatus Methylobacter favarea]CAA9890490.1 DNA repair protein RecO [Candidatus Methylobacter favarea]
MSEPYRVWALMTDTAVYLQPAFILQHRKYRETSLIIDVLTRDFGRISLLAKGVRKAKSKTAGLLQPFLPLAISYIGKGELKTLTDVEVMQPFPELKGLGLYCGFYINELIGLFLHKYDPHPEVFAYYEACLSRLSDSSKIEAALRIFELDLMDNIGYGLQLKQAAGNKKPINPSKHYAFNIEQGPIEDENGLFSGKTLQAISARDLTDAHVLAEAKILMRAAIDTHLQGKPLKSRTVIHNMVKHTKNE